MPGRLTGRQPALDGLRAVAVAAVLLFHGGVAAAPGGFLGVDIFFVLSGYLITMLLLREQQLTGRIALGAFWARRARRLLPALFVVLVAVALYAAFLVEPQARLSLRLDGLATLGYLGNWRQLGAAGGYFAQGATPSPLRHTWSLSIEEQFYLVWPLVVVALLRGRALTAGRVRRILAVAVIGALLSAVLMALLVGGDVSRVYYGTDTRAQSVLVGCALAALLRLRRPAAAHSRVVALVGSLGLAAVIAAMVTVAGTDPRLYDGGLLLFDTAVAALLAAVVLAPDGALARLLSVRPLPALGRISYGVYLWHWPVFVVVTAERTGLDGLRLLALRLGVTLVLAVLSWRLVERPVLGGALTGWRGRLSLPVTAAAVVVALLVATPQAAGPALIAASQAEGSVVTVRAHGPVPVAHAQPAGAGPRRPHPGPLRVLLLGDSVALTLGQTLPEYPGLSVASEAILGCGLARGTPYRYFGSVRDEPPQCQTWPQRWSEAVARTDPDVVAVLVGRWEVMDRMRDRQWQHVGEPAFDDYIAGELKQAITVLGAHGARVVFLTAPYYHRGERPDGGTFPEDEPWRVDTYNGVLARVVARHVGSAALLPFGAQVSPGRAYTRYVNGLAMRYDGVHLTPRGVQQILAPWLLPRLLAEAPWRAGPGQPSEPSQPSQPSQPGSATG
ncbi:MAG: acyltransferase family protein [Frankiaceae bacterium]